MKSGGVVYVNVAQVNRGEVLKGKRVLITGGTSGIGFAIAEKFLLEGAAVLITGRDESKLSNAASLLENKAHTLLWDVSDISIVKTQIQKVINILGGLDIVINNAGVYSSVPFCSVDENNWNKIMDVNIKGLFFMCQSASLELKKNSGGGKIINISSIAGFQGYASPYGLSKASVNSLTVGLAKQLLQYNIIVNGIAPGNVATKMTGINPADNMYDTLSKNERAAMPIEIAEIALFLASDASNNIVGQMIICDGGATLL
jgi:3-oxoacyl-[acyl-carrier protein] reductase